MWFGWIEFDLLLGESPLLVRLLDFRHIVADQHFMLQKEVVDRIVSPPGGTDYSRLTVLMQMYYDCEKLFDVPPEALLPLRAKDLQPEDGIPLLAGAVGVAALPEPRDRMRGNHDAGKQHGQAQHRIGDAMPIMPVHEPLARRRLA